MKSLTSPWHGQVAHPHEYGGWIGKIGWIGAIGWIGCIGSIGKIGWIGSVGWAKINKYLIVYLI